MKRQRRRQGFIEGFEFWFDFGDEKWSGGGGTVGALVQILKWEQKFRTHFPNVDFAKQIERFWCVRWCEFLERLKKTGGMKMQMAD